jgi:flagellar biosynthesis chaperone FliJ
MSGVHTAADRRNFRWPFAPLQGKAGWELERSRMQLADCLRQLALAQASLRALEAEAVQHGSCVAGAGVLDARFYRQRLAYLADVRSRMDAAAAQQAGWRQQAHRAQSECARSQQRLDALERLEQAQWRAHAQQASASAAREADLAWLARRGAGVEE